MPIEGRPAGACPKAPRGRVWPGSYPKSMISKKSLNVKLSDRQYNGADVPGGRCQPARYHKTSTSDSDTLSNSMNRIALAQNSGQRVSGCPRTPTASTSAVYRAALPAIFCGARGRRKP